MGMMGPSRTPYELEYWDDRRERERRPDLPFFDERNQPVPKRPGGTLIQDFSHDLEADRDDGLVPSRRDWQRQHDRHLRRRLLGPLYASDEPQSVAPDVAGEFRDPADWMLPGDWDDPTRLGYHGSGFFMPGRIETPAPPDDSAVPPPWWEYFEDTAADPSRAAARLTAFMNEGLITSEELDRFLDEAFRTDRIPAREWLQQRRVRQLLSQGEISQEIAEELERKTGDPYYPFPANDLRLKVMKYCRMLEEVRDFMDDWIQRGMPADEGSGLEKYITEKGQSDSADASLGSRSSALKKGRSIIGSAWAVFRRDIDRAIGLAKDPDKVTFSHIGLVAGGMNMPGIPGYTLDISTVQKADPFVVMMLMVHEPMHDFGELFLGHNCQEGWPIVGNRPGTGWSDVNDAIGWSLPPDWGLGVEKALRYATDIMKRSPSKDGSGESAWVSALHRCGIPSTFGGMCLP
jgi:hypothetical protein